MHCVAIMHYASCIKHASYNNTNNMNTNKYILSTALLLTLAMGVVSCEDETMPTTVALEEQVQKSPAATEGLLAACPAYFNNYSSTWVDRGHYTFSYGALMYIRDLQTGDMAQNTTNYSHQSYWIRNQYQGDNYIFGQYIWQYYYGELNVVNNLVGAVDPENATDTQLGYLGVGLAMRAHAYLDLARLYEYLPNPGYPEAYKQRYQDLDAVRQGNSIEGLTVPIVKSGMSQDSARMNPRATHEQMYAFIKGDLDEAEQYITKLGDTRGKTLPDLAVVYGLKARLYMWNGEYANAKDYARKAIDASGLQPMTEDDCLDIQTGFNTPGKWMWASTMTKEDNLVKTGIINWTSWLSNQTNFGYTGGSTGLFTTMSAEMYDRISDTDFRKCEFVAPAGSELAAKVRWIPNFKSVVDASGTQVPDYTSFKFRPAEGNPDESSVGAASSFPLMRVEEMYFIEAEAAAQLGQGPALINAFMQQYRDPAYNCQKSGEDLVEEIVFQKRVELWGEGQTLFDLKRLNYGVHRGYIGTNFYDSSRFNTVGRPAWANYVMVRNEGDNNKAVNGWNNPDPSDVYELWTAQ